MTNRTLKHGSALLVVLFVVMAITIISLGFLTRSDVELACGSNMGLRVKMDYLAESGLEHARGLILNPEGTDTDELGYWSGAVRQQLVGGDDYYDISVVRDDVNSTSQWVHYLITCSAYKEKGGEKVGQRNLSAVLRVQRTEDVLLMVVVDPCNLNGLELIRKTLIESWGWDVTLISAAASQAEFNTAVTQANVAYVSTEISDLDLGTKLRSAGIGVVNEHIDLVDDFGFGTNNGSPKLAAIEILDNSHYITEDLGLGSLTLLTAQQRVVCITGSLAPALQILAENSEENEPILGTLETGDALEAGGGTAVDRRVQLPWGCNTFFDFTALNSDGQTIMKRSIEWAAGQNGDN